VTLLEEYELAPTCELWFTGCSLRCRFCTVPEAIEHPTRGAWLPPQALVQAISAPTVPPFRAVAMVGGDPTVHRPYLDRLLPLLRRALPDRLLALNTNLYLPAPLAARDARAYDWIVGDVHFWQEACADRIAGVPGYPAVAVAAAEAVVQAGGRLLLRVLVLPGHHDCCAAPTVAWAADLAARAEGRVRVHLMTHYAPAGRARGDPELGRWLEPQEQAAARALLPAGCPVPAATPVDGVRARPATAVDPPAPLELGPDGSVLLPFVTGALLPLAVSLRPELAPRLSLLDPPTAALSEIPARPARARRR
jgi:putative pyruvate formate lyase activating enzyme